MNNKLHQYFEDAIHNRGENIYLKTTSAQYSYRSVYEMALKFQDVLIKNGIQKNDRIIIYSIKNAESIAMMIACSLCNSIYVPISTLNPVQRIKYIILETSPRFILCDVQSTDEFKKTELECNIIYSENKVNLYSTSNSIKVYSDSGDAGFILFTSGSTGTPKGVVISHSAAIAFIDWAADEFRITLEDVIASIAPFNFDLSVFDIYVTAKINATLLLFSEEEVKNALLIAQQISLDKATTIYATPTFYSTLTNYGRLHKYDYSCLKNILFAGEIFHLQSFRKMMSYWPNKKYANLYGPTETNVCTFFRVNPESIDYTIFPIGKPCSFAELKILNEDETEISEKNLKGELLVTGKSLFNGYWNDISKTKASIYIDKENKQYYKTGDLVYKNENDDYVYVSRKDRMIKKNGFRIEPSEIEKVMLAYPSVSNVAVLFSELNNQLICFLEKIGDTKEDLISLKSFCKERLPIYMIPDKFVFLDVMPTTATGKVNIQDLINLV